MTSAQPAPYAHLAPPLSADQLVDDDLDQLADGDDVSRETSPAGTPLSALATPDDDAGQEAELETLEARVKLADGRSWSVLVLNRDFVAYDLIRHRKKWPTAEDAPFILNTYLAFSASKRAGQYVGTLEEFTAQADVVNLSKGTPVRPTR